jgi:hypothetical protein
MPSPCCDTSARRDESLTSTQHRPRSSVGVRPVDTEAYDAHRSKGHVLMPLASAWAVALHEADGVLVEIEFQYPI